MTQFEQENDLGRGGGEVDDETMEDAWKTAAERRSTANIEGEPEEEGEEDGPQPWAKLSSGKIDDDE
jgi:hypothetical protein